MSEIYYEVPITIIVLVILLYIYLLVSVKKNNESVEQEKMVIENKIIKNVTKDFLCSDEKSSENKIPNRIPNRIIQTYFSREVPIRMYEASLTFQDKNPTYDYIFYDDIEARRFLLKHFDRNVTEAFDLLIPGAFKADLFRLCELYINGGYYVDLDMIDMLPLNYFDKYNTECILTIDRNPDWIYNAFIGVVPKNDLINYSIDKTVQNILSRNIGNNPLDITGPSFLGKILKIYLNISNFTPGLYDKILFLTHTDLQKSYICDGENILIQTKYDNHRNDIPSHYADLYRMGKVFK